MRHPQGNCSVGDCKSSEEDRSEHKESVLTPCDLQKVRSGAYCKPCNYPTQPLDPKESHGGKDGESICKGHVLVQASRERDIPFAHGVHQESFSEGTKCSEKREDWEQVHKGHESERAEEDSWRHRTMKLEFRRALELLEEGRPGEENEASQKC